jgi:serine O-acetyltransferase
MDKTRQNELKALVAAMAKSYESEQHINPHRTGTLPGRDGVIEIIDKLRRLMFPGFFGDKTYEEETREYYVGGLLTDILAELSRQIAFALKYESDTPGGGTPREVTEKAKILSTELLFRIPTIREYLATDVEAAFDGDPAATSHDEIVFSYPGFLAISIHRIAHELYKMKVPLIPRMMGEYAHSITGIDIHPGATIGKYFFIDHGTGVVIGETTHIGDRVKVYQGVTLGAMSTRGGQTLRGAKRHPTLEDDVTIYSGASIFGGETVIGKGSTVGSNCFITESIPAGSRVSIKNPELSFKIPSVKKKA